MSEEEFKPITMKVVTEKAAFKLIKNTDDLVIVHSKDECPVCQYFIPEVLQPVLEKYKHVTSVMVKEQLTFPVGAHPVIYFFKNGKCVQHPSGSAPEDAVDKMMEAFYGN
jgi:thioredoxin-like negative regulator of GroEL